MFAINGPGSVLWNPQQVQQWAAQAMQQQPTQYGYGQAPGASNRGYFEQQTPAGSFAAADQQRANAFMAGNPYIGQTLGQSVVPYAQQIADRANQANPYLGQSSQQAAAVGANPYSGANPYLEQSIEGTINNATRAFNDVTNPQFDRMAQASGSFGNTGVEAARTRAQQDFGSNLANTVGNMRMQDYGMQQQLSEAALNRQQQNNQFNSSLGAADLNRNLLGSFTQAGQGIQGLNTVLNAAQFDAGMSQADLSRNANLAQNLSQFNAGAGNQNSQFNASQGNAMNLSNANAANNMLSQQRNLNQQQGQFDQNMDFNVWNANQNWMNTGQRNQMDFLSTLLGMNQQGINAATGVQNTPMNYWQQFAGGAGGLGGLGGTSTQNLQGNPYLSAIGGALTGGQLWNGWRG